MVSLDKRKVLFRSLAMGENESGFLSFFSVSLSSVRSRRVDAKDEIVMALGRVRRRGV